MPLLTTSASVPAKNNRLIVVGGGAAGLMAAGQAAERGVEVVLLEKMAQPGRKINISGKGRCNLTNTAALPEFLTHFGKNGKFLRQCFQQFFSPDLLSFFAEHGLETVIERGGRVFPAQGRAADVVGVFRDWVAQLPVSVRPGSRVEELLVENGQVRGVLCNGNAVLGRAVILATGGASYPATGSNGDGYRLAEAVGHSIVPIRPALVPVETSGGLAARLAGLQLRNVGVRLLINGKRKEDAFGELLFMKYGLSGPVILTLSKLMVDALRLGEQVSLLLDLKPALDEQKLEARLLRDFADRRKETMASVLRGLLPEQLVPVCCGETALRPEALAGEVTAAERKRLRCWLKSIPFPVTGYRSFKEAIVTAGGIELTEVDPRTMQSKLCAGLYLAGELLDLQADTGGYNLQAAFSTGWLAGRSAAAQLKEV
ncbi:NAD(P)/FAD-dependent oxidoreductase [Candidatus Electronema sp. PJ]|uniref:NAD(P)/FAD-dependent oxidoreductase n=1 Tax=Candidatus Electronema sp. PJ TaxID=3401572 RepID=UPI003AA96579